MQKAQKNAQILFLVPLEKRLRILYYINVNNNGKILYIFMEMFLWQNIQSLGLKKC